MLMDAIFKYNIMKKLSYAKERKKKKTAQMTSTNTNSELSWH
jgi:hypothetical protein